MGDSHRYRQRGAELARRAQRIEAPELRLIYLGLAAGYDRLARFRERLDPRGDAGPDQGDAPDRGDSDETSRDD